jgi:DNA-binding transcriptional regulator YiaG
MCARCRTKTVWPVTIPYATSIRYEGALVKVQVPQLIVPRCESCGELYFDNYADEQIHDAFRAQEHLLTPKQIQSNRTALGLSRGELAAGLGTTEELVTRWEDGLEIQSRISDNLLRVFFAMPPVRAALADAKQHGEFGAVAVV